MRESAERKSEKTRRLLGRVPGMQFSDPRMRVARCISIRIDLDEDRAFWVSLGATANSYPARATSYISEYLRRPAPPLAVLPAFWDATRISGEQQFRPYYLTALLPADRKKTAGKSVKYLPSSYRY